MNGNLVKRLLHESELKTKVRSVKILWAPNANLQPGKGSKEDLEMLGQALPSFSGLRSFIWDAQYAIVPWLLEVLRSAHPRCKLYIRHPSSPDAARTLVRLRDLPCLFSLDVITSPGQFQAFEELDRVLTTTSPTHVALAANFTVFKQYQDEEIQPRRVKSLEFRGCIDFIDYLWKFPVLWSDLKRLSFTMGNSNRILSYKSPSLDKLRALELRCQWNGNGDNLKELLQGCPQLKSLDLTGFRSCIRNWSPSLWRQLGRTLVKLRLCEDRRFAGTTTILSDATMKLIAKECPKLRSLGFDLDCDGSWVRIITCNVLNDELTIHVADSSNRIDLGPFFRSHSLRAQLSGPSPSPVHPD